MAANEKGIAKRSHRPQPANLAEIAQSQGLLGLLRAAAMAADAILPAAVAQEPRQLLMIPGRLVQAARNRSFLHQLAEEFEDLRQQGRIKDHVLTGEQGTICFQELLAGLDDPPVDKIKFDALKAIFLTACTEELTNRDDVRPPLLMRIARGLSSGEILLLGVVYKNREALWPQSHGDGSQSAANWLQDIAKLSGFHNVELVMTHEARLMQEKLLDGRLYPDGSGVRVGKENNRLTGLGMTLCQFMLSDLQSSNQNGTP
jgi:hypothetical protein